MKLAIVALLLGCAACSAKFPNCLAHGTAAAVGRWQYAGRLPDTSRQPEPAGALDVPAAQIGRPAELELRDDGTFSARFDTPPAGAPSPIGTAVPAATVSGHWKGGSFCVESSFAPWMQVGMDPPLPNAASIQISGGNLMILGTGSGVADAQYRRLGEPDSAPATPR